LESCHELPKSTCRLSSRPASQPALGCADIMYNRYIYTILYYTILYYTILYYIILYYIILYVVETMWFPSTMDCSGVWMKRTVRGEPVKDQDYLFVQASSNPAAPARYHAASSIHSDLVAKQRDASSFLVPMDSRFTPTSYSLFVEVSPRSILVCITITFGKGATCLFLLW
jgi:hypothetical protein